jgi:hypothetical protein
MRRAAALLLLAAPVLAAQDRLDLANRSGQPWTLALVEGIRPGLGRVRFVDKFTGLALASLSRTGDTAVIPARSRALLVFDRSGGDFFRTFILKDLRGYYAEYRASVDFLTSPRVDLRLLGGHVGPPMDRADETAVRTYLEEAVEIERENIIIHPNFLEGPPSTHE